MGVYIKGMEMPKSCARCFLRVGQCSRRIYMENRPSDCPLIEVPEPHGDMKDINHINQVLDRFSGYLDDDMIYRLKIAIGRDAPTVIPAVEEMK